MTLDIHHRSQEALDWADLLALVSGNCGLTATVSWLSGREHRAGVLLADTAEESQRRFQVVSEIWRLLDDGEQVPVAGVRDCREELRLIEQGANLELHQWVSVANAVGTLQDLHKWLVNHFDVAPSLMDELQSARVDPVVVDTLRSSFDESGELSENYYPSLGRLREKCIQVKRAMDEEVRRLMQDERITRHLQEEYVTERNGRIVFPMKTSYQRKIGIAHASSRSGETIFVEPISLLPLSNALQETEFAIEQEIRTILRRLLLLVRPHVPATRALFYGAVRLDLRKALATLGRQWSAICPEVSNDGIVELQNMRHPLLIDKTKVVGNDFVLSPTQPAIVFSGPNAGGKTIALKSIGIAAWMVKLGLPIPADHARVDFFDCILADVGDAQTVQEGLSSFSAHLLLMNEVMERADRSTLVLLDEIGMGTDPAQGAALAQAIIEQLLTQGSKLVVTTHFTRLKAFASTDKRCAMAAMHIVNGVPTHRLQWGEVGESEALSLAERMNLPEFLILRARNLLHNGERQLAELIHQLESQRKELDSKTEEVEFIRSEIQRQKDVLERKNRVWDERKERLEEKLKQDTRAELKSVEYRANQLLKKIREGKSLKEATKQATALKALRTQLTPEKPKPDPIDEDVVLQVGDSVHVILMDALGKVQSLNGEKMEVSVNGMVMRVTRSDVALPPPTHGGHPIAQKKLNKQKRKRQQKSRGQKTHTPPTEITVIRSTHNTCDLRGVRVEEAFIQLEMYFDDMVLKGRKRVFILHGHGTGALRSGIRGWIGSSQYVSSWRPAKTDEGGDAFTIVELK